jgi:anthranilate phosphoribosyltransferase
LFYKYDKVTTNIKTIWHERALKDTTMIREGIQAVVSGQDLSEADAAAVMTEIMDGEATPAQIAAFITGLRMKGETVDEITGCARIMRDKATLIRTPEGSTPVDTAGTGGDGARTFNISTTAAFVAAGAGVMMAKHGNRAASSECGSADLLEAMGINIAPDPELVATAVRDVGIGFLFAAALHGAMRHAIGPRREIGIRTIFNILGPLTNPARSKHQLVGIFDGSLTATMATVLGNLGAQRAFVVHGSDGLDEITTTGPTTVSELRHGQVLTYAIHPADFGLPTKTPEELKGGDAAYNAELTRRLLQGENLPQRHIVLLNAAAAIAAGTEDKTIADCLPLAQEALDSGRGWAKLEQLRELTPR